MIDFDFDKKFSKPVIGIDEVGRGSWAGPVMSGAVLLDYEKPLHKKLNDSKKIPSKMRYEVFDHLKKNAIYGIGEASNNEIDNYGIMRASFISMERALKELIDKSSKIKISTLLIDGIHMPDFQNTYGADIKLIKKGDTFSPSIAAASVIAKCTRDLLMIKMDKVYRGYELCTNMGYGTNSHRKKLLISGPTQFHRMTFAPMKNIN